MTTPKPDASRVLEAISSQHWAIQPEWLETIVAIAERRQHDFEAVLARRAEPLRGTAQTSIRDGVAIVPVRGPIFRYANLFTEVSGATSIDVLATDFGAALADPAVQAIVLEIDSPGGMVSGVSEFADQIRAATATKPVIAYVSDMGASGAYWLAAAAGEVVAADTAKIGSIGVVASIQRGKDESVVRFVSSQSPRKQADPSTEAGTRDYQALADAQADVFIGAVARYRGVSTEKVLADFGQGSVMIGAQAVAAGMVDRIGSLESILASLSGDQRKPRGNAMSGNATITRDFIVANHPQIAEQLRAEGAASVAITAESVAQQHPSVAIALRGEGAAAERARIQAVHAAGLPGYEKQIEAMMFDGTTSAGDAALAIVKLERETAGKQRDGIVADGAKLDVVVHAPTPAGAVDVSTLPLEDRCKAEWDTKPALRQEFSSLEAYVAFEKATANGRAKIHGKG